MRQWSRASESDAEKKTKFEMSRDLTRDQKTHSTPNTSQMLRISFGRHSASRTSMIHWWVAEIEWWNQYGESPFEETHQTGKGRCVVLSHLLWSEVIFGVSHNALTTSFVIGDRNIKGSRNKKWPVRYSAESDEVVKILILKLVLCKLTSNQYIRIGLVYTNDRSAIFKLRVDRFIEWQS